MKGLEIFKEHFKGYEDCFVIIGGTACTLLLEEIGGNFRATKDVDRVLIAEHLSIEFGKKFWDFIKNGQYLNIYCDQARGKFYRFEKPNNEHYPFMIELFSRQPINYEISFGSHLIPLHIAEDISSLSAILLNDDYYQFLLDGKKIIDGISILDEYHLIPFKAKAWCELTDRQNAGEEGLSKHIKKHKKDIAVLLSLVILGKTINLNGMVLQDMVRFEKEMQKEDINEKTTGIINMSTQLYCSQLKAIYSI